ncbi:hypothetical protein SELMODRAFT_441572 [Selaginella moellendorffii]|uniref:Cytochrome b5 domain-containing protein 1 n=1 Tax=Selaginella moellendorffii TaxID=88036 RepID=D8RKR4_SELML|nr:hypothetical protein SELMODRAFT_441572 [Selaginella moellendorffii]
MACPRRSSRWYTANEVKEHCTLGDCWVTSLGTVYDVTKLIPKNPGVLGKLLVYEAGGDISHWFDAKTGSVKLYRDPVSNVETFDVPQGRFVHIPPTGPRTDWNSGYPFDWWNDPEYIIGKLSRKTRMVRIKNVLIDHEILLEVPSEENVQHILERYLAYNAHANSYTWKAMCVNDKKEFVDLSMEKTLTENGIADEADLFVSLGLASYFYIPVVHIYFNDDLTVA